MNISEALSNISFKLVYIRYKQFIVPFIVILGSVFLGLFVVMPQLSDYFKTREQEQSIKEENAQIARNIQILSSLSEAELSDQLSVALSAVPAEKDYIGILGSISYAAAQSGVGLSDFSFSVGDISKIDKDIPLDISLQVQGSIDAVEQFLQALSLSLPLSEVTKTELTQTSSQIDITFSYKEKPNVNKETALALKPFSAEDKSLLETLSSYANGNEVFFFNSQIPSQSNFASESATISAQSAPNSF